MISVFETRVLRGGKGSKLNELFGPLFISPKAHALELIFPYNWGHDDMPLILMGGSLKNNSFWLVKKFIVRALLVLMTSTEFAFAGSAVHDGRSIRSDSTSPIHFNAAIGQIVFGSPYPPPFLAPISKEVYPNFITMIKQIRWAIPNENLDNMNFTRIDNQGLLLPDVSSERLNNLRLQGASADVPRPLIKVGVVSDFNNPQGFHAMPATPEFLIHVKRLLESHKYRDALDASGRAFDGATASGGVLTVPMPDAQTKPR